MDFSNLLTTALSIVSIATLAGLGLLRGTVTNLRENLKDAREEIIDKERRLADAEKKIVEQQNDLNALARVVTGEAHWEELNHQLDEHHQTVVAGIAVLRQELKDSIQDVRTELRNR